MSEVSVPFGDSPADTATLLLAAAEELGLDAGVVKTTGRREFSVPSEVHDQAFGERKKPAKRTAKKAAAKKSTASTRSDAT